MSRLEVISLGGCGEIGKNCFLLRQNGSILVIDCGLAFPSDEMFGVDIVIPDFTYLLENRDEVAGIIITHGHEDHVGALPYLLRDLDVPVYMSRFTKVLTEPKIQERLRGTKRKIEAFEAGDDLAIGPFMVDTIRVTHSIPEACSLAVRTDTGIVFHTGDFKFDNTPVDGILTDFDKLSRVAREGVLLLLSDCTGVERPGWGPSESHVSHTLEEVFAEAPGRILVTTFASNIHRVQQVVDCARLYERKVAVVGRRMEQNVDVSIAHGYLRFHPDTRVRIQDVDRYPDDQIVIVTTGAQGEPLSALTLMAQDEYPKARIKPGDTVIISATPIPGNEASVWRTVNRLFALGAKVIYSNVAPVHVTGHACSEELKMMLALTRPQYVAPVHGEARHVAHYREMATAMGYRPEAILSLDLGVPLVLDGESAWHGDPVPCGRVLVDSAGGAGISEDVARDRRQLAKDGIVFVSVGIDIENGAIVSGPDFTARGLACEDEGVFDEAAEEVRRAVESLDLAESRDVDAVQAEIRDLTRRFLRKRTQLHPVVVAVVLEA